ncbi:aspartyl/asparaginyl beta-hydroxylase domain-containing protein [Nannocystis pusilla]|uniref:aspartyl/asparaginyl beta-hydroxylase domain-containing protein n=1 Tax=Nannocystis pusilla TaxID=889268 RepID=UPI003B78367A
MPRHDGLCQDHLPRGAVRPGPADVAPAGGRIPFHADYSERKLASISIALNHPEGCRFLYRDRGVVHEVPFADGRAFAVNLSYEHSVINDSQVDRFHLIVHVLRGNDRFRELFLRSFLCTATRARM